MYRKKQLKYQFIVFPHCQVRVVWFYISCPAASFFSASSASAGPPLQAQDQSVPSRASTASSGSECSAPDLNRKLRIKVFPAGPQPRAPDQSVPSRASTASSGSECFYRTSTASSGSECSPPDLNRKLRIKVFPAGPQPRAPDQSVPSRTSTASSGSECSPPDLNHKESPKIYQTECQIEGKKISEIKCECQIECLNICQKMSLGGDHSKKLFFLLFSHVIFIWIADLLRKVSKSSTILHVGTSEQQRPWDVIGM